MINFEDEGESWDVSAYLLKTSCISERPRVDCKGSSESSGGEAHEYLLFVPHKLLKSVVIKLSTIRSDKFLV